MNLIVEELAQNPVLKKMYEQWCALEQQKYETYTSAVQKFPPLEANKVFKPIKNAVIRAVLEMEFSTEIFTEYNEDGIGEIESDKDLYVKRTVEYKSACSELYKTTISRKRSRCCWLKLKREISSPFLMLEKCIGTDCLAKKLFRNPINIL